MFVDFMPVVLSGSEGRSRSILVRLVLFFPLGSSGGQRCARSTKNVYGVDGFDERFEYNTCITTFAEVFSWSGNCSPTDTAVGDKDATLPVITKNTFYVDDPNPHVTCNGKSVKVSEYSSTEGVDFGTVVTDSSKFPSTADIIDMGYALVWDVGTEHH